MISSKIRIACEPAEYPATRSISRNRPWIQTYSSRQLMWMRCNTQWTCFISQSKSGIDQTDQKARETRFFESPDGGIYSTQLDGKHMTFGRVRTDLRVCNQAQLNSTGEILNEHNGICFVRKSERFVVEEFEGWLRWMGDSTCSFSRFCLTENTSSFPCFQISNQESHVEFDIEFLNTVMISAFNLSLNSYRSNGKMSGPISQIV